MNQSLFEKINILSGADTSTRDQIIQLLSLPDELFKQAYSTIKESIEQAYSEIGVQKEILQTVQSMSINVEDEEQALEEAVSEIWAEEGLIDEKKDVLETVMRAAMSTMLDFLKNPRERIPVKIQLLNEDAKIPTYAHNSDAGADVYTDKDITIPPHKTAIVSTGIKIAIPAGYEVQIRPRSGLSAKTPLRVANAPGTIDSEYRGEIGIIIENTGNLTQKINKGDKIAQMLIAPTPMIKWEQVSTLDETDRGENGFGSTDKKS